MIDYSEYIGRRVSKVRARLGREPKPFKSGQKVNTVRGVIEHPILRVRFQITVNWKHCQSPPLGHVHPPLSMQVCAQRQLSG